VKSLVPIVDRLRARFSIVDVTVVADRGMVSEQTLGELEQRGCGYILGARMRREKVVRDKVLADETPFEEIVKQRRTRKTRPTA